jgi:hypothetical protein
MTVYREGDEGKRMNVVSLLSAVEATGLYGYGDMDTRKRRLIDGEILVGEGGSYFVRKEDE